MSETPDVKSFHTPEFVRAREAWYKAGAGAMTAYSAIAILIVSVATGIASLIFSIGPYQVAISILLGTWVCIALLSFYIEITARAVVSRGGVQVDQF